MRKYIFIAAAVLLLIQPILATNYPFIADWYYPTDSSRLMVYRSGVLQYNILNDSTSEIDTTLNLDSTRSYDAVLKIYRTGKTVPDGYLWTIRPKDTTGAIPDFELWKIMPYWSYDYVNAKLYMYVNGALKDTTDDNAYDSVYNMDTTVTAYNDSAYQAILKLTGGGFGSSGVTYEIARYALGSTGGAAFPFSTSTDEAVLFVVVHFNGTPIEGALLTVRNDYTATDTVNNIIIGNFFKWDKTDNLGAAYVSVPKSYLYHDSLKSLYDIAIKWRGKTIKSWSDYYVIDQDSIRLVVDD